MYRVLAVSSSSRSRCRGAGVERGTRKVGGTRVVFIIIEEEWVGSTRVPKPPTFNITTAQIIRVPPFSRVLQHTARLDTVFGKFHRRVVIYHLAPAMSPISASVPSLGNASVNNLMHGRLSTEFMDGEMKQDSDSKDGGRKSLWSLSSRCLPVSFRHRRT